jgi:hypothetical protein
MSMNRIQFQQGLSLPAFQSQFGTEEQCADALEASRWPEEFRCPECDSANYYLLKGGKHKTFQCKCCRLQTSLIAGTLFQSTHLAHDCSSLVGIFKSVCALYLGKSGLAEESF